jgi:hypothetical protein
MGLSCCSCGLGAPAGCSLAGTAARARALWMRCSMTAAAEDSDVASVARTGSAGAAGLGDLRPAIMLSSSVVVTGAAACCMTGDGALKAGLPSGDAGRRGRTSSNNASHALLCPPPPPSPDCGSGAGLRRCGMSACDTAGVSARPPRGGGPPPTPPAATGALLPPLPGAPSRTTRTRGAAARASRPCDPSRAAECASARGCDPNNCTAALLGRPSRTLPPSPPPRPMSSPPASSSKGEGERSAGRAGTLANGGKGP